MARYIDAVECAEKISEKFNIPLGDLVDVFAEIPTADVVPKNNEYKMFSSKEEYKAYRIKVLKQDLAREIFDEIKSFARSLSDEYKGYADSEHKNPLLQAGYRGGQISALRILKRIDELKKKYTEEKT